MADVQIEGGNFTRIHNGILEHLIASNLNGTEKAIILFLIRKTYGFNKLNDEISLSQFTKAIPVSKWSICLALKHLQLVNIIRLVKKGSSKLCSNLWHFNKDYDTWQLVKKTRLVKFLLPTSQLFTTPTSQEKLTHKRQRTKDNTKERYIIPPLFDWVKRYCEEQKYGFDPQEFIDVYEARGWMVGKFKMKDWEAAVRTFQRNRLKWSPEKGKDISERRIL